MTLTVEITLDNAAFEVYAGHEAARILRTLADQIADRALTDPGEIETLRDSNGNRVGRAFIAPEGD